MLERNFRSSQHRLNRIPLVYVSHQEWDCCQGLPIQIPYKRCENIKTGPATSKNRFKLFGKSFFILEGNKLNYRCPYNLNTFGFKKRGFTENSITLLLTQSVLLNIQSEKEIRTNMENKLRFNGFGVESENKVSMFERD